MVYYHVISFSWVAKRLQHTSNAMHIYKLELILNGTQARTASRVAYWTMQMERLSELFVPIPTA